jgi:hypothetical protein
MSRDLFLRIMNVVESYDEYFVQKRSAANVLILSCIQKVIAAFRMLTYGVPANATESMFALEKVPQLRAYVGSLLQLLIYLKMNT